MPKPLAGLRILVTRPEHQAKPFADRLLDLGASVIQAPLIWIGPPQSWAALDAAIARLQQYDWVVFASANAVTAFFERLGKLEKSIANQAPRLAAIGPATAQALQQHGFQPDFQPPQYVAESLISSFPGYPQLAGTQVLWPKTNIGRTLIADQLKKAGAVVDVVACYRTELPANAQELGRQLVELLQAGQLDVITLTSAQTAKNLGTVLGQHHPPERIAELLQGVAVLTIGPQTAKAAQAALGDVQIRQPSQFTSQAMIELLLDGGA